MKNATRCPSKMSLTKLIDELNEWERPLSCLELKSVLVKYPLNRNDLGHFVRFQKDKYSHQVIDKSRFIELGCIAWRPGQASPVHDHRGSNCCVKVIQGVLTNTDYIEEADRGLQMIDRVQLFEGEFLLRHDRQVHCISNEDSTGRELISLHVYSPPLLPIEERICVLGCRSERDS